MKDSAANYERQRSQLWKTRRARPRDTIMNDERTNSDKASGLYDVALDIAYIIADDSPTAVEDATRQMRETLALTCGEALAGSGHAYGNLFAQVDILCKRHGVSMSERAAVQVMRHHCNHPQDITKAEAADDLRALVTFISAVFSVPVPGTLTAALPHYGRKHAARRRIDARYVRCIVQNASRNMLLATVEDGIGGDMIAIDCTADELSHIPGIVAEGTQLNLLDSEIADAAVAGGGEAAYTLMPSIIVVEPDFLIDISAIASCFTAYGHHELGYLLSRMRPRPNTQAILLGNFAGAALDDIIASEGGSYDVNAIIWDNFRDKALEYCTCEDFDSRLFIADARRQAANISEAVANLFGTGGKPGRYDRRNAVLEPSFVCERLGLQGRVDLMTDDFRLLVEQKSGKNLAIARRQAGSDDNRTAVSGNKPSAGAGCRLYSEQHFVQLLLYYGVLHYNFGIDYYKDEDFYLLYSKYPAADGLVAVNFYRALFAEAIALRNRIVANEYAIAHGKIGEIIDMMTPETLNVNHIDNCFYNEYLLPQILDITSPLHAMPPLERAYFCRMMTFVYMEHLSQKVGTHEGVHGCAADLWSMPLSEKRETGNIYTGLTTAATDKGPNGDCLLTMSVPAQGETFTPNFRRGDMVYIYRYKEGSVPDICRSILYRGNIKDIGTATLTVALAGDQRIAGGTEGLFCIEHCATGASASGAVRGLHAFISADPRRRQLLLGQREPEADRGITLSKSHGYIDDIVLRAMQARDYFLLCGPPGTGKTTVALRSIVEEEMAGGTQGILLMAYTNRAVDEICLMLEAAGIDYLRIGNEYSCDPALSNRLVSNAFAEKERLAAMKKRIAHVPVIAATTSMMQARPFIFALRTFGLTVIDEAAQIIEPDIIGLLAATNSRFILIGDHKQLPAVVQQDPALTAVNEPQLRAIGLTDCRNSLFQRLLAIEREAGRTAFTGILSRQGRMHPDVAAFPNMVFYGDERLQTVPLPHQTEPHRCYDAEPEDAIDATLAAHRVVFIPSKPCRAPSVSDKVNASEARIVADVLRRIRRLSGAHFDSKLTVGVIVPYRNQIAMIRQEIDRLGIGGDLRDISIDTVERFQGSQRDIIVYSFTAQSPYQLSFLTASTFDDNGTAIDRKLNVVLTRARRQLICTGNEALLRRNKLFSCLMEHVKANGGWVVTE